MKLEFSFSCKVGGPDATLVSALTVFDHFSWIVSDFSASCGGGAGASLQ